MNIYIIKHRYYNLPPASMWTVSNQLLSIKEMNETQYYSCWVLCCRNSIHTCTNVGDCISNLVKYAFHVGLQTVLFAYR